MPNVNEWVSMASALADALGPVAYEKVRLQGKSEEYVPNIGENLVILALRWAEFEMMLDALEERYSPGSALDDWRSASEVRQIAQKAKTKALEDPGYLPMVNIDLGIYQKIFETFVELVSTEVEVYNAVLRACDAHAPSDRVRDSHASSEEENALFSVRYIQSLGDEALKILPDTTKEQSETRLTPGDFWWPVGATVFWLFLVLTEGWPLKDMGWIPDVITDTSPIWYGAIALGSWLMTFSQVNQEGV